MRQLFTIALTLFLVIDALGSIPAYRPLVHRFTPRKRLMITIREMFIALAIMIMFHYFGRILLSFLELDKSTVLISGGIVLFLIAVRLIFSHEDESHAKWEQGELFIVPIATPIFAGPTTLATIMIFAQEHLDLMMFEGIFIAWFFSALIFIFSEQIYRLIKEKGLMACQRLMGLIVALLAVQILMKGISEVMRSGFNGLKFF